MASDSYTAISDTVSETPILAHADLVEVIIKDLPRRAITVDTCRRYGYGVDDQNRQVAPYRNASGRIVGQKVRTRDKRFTFLGTNPGTLWGQHLSKPGGRNLIITEGEIDCMSMSQIQGNKWPCVSLPTGAGGAVRAIKQNLSWVESFDRVVLFFDQDEPGQEAAAAVAATLQPGKAAIARFDGKDPNELLVACRSSELVTAFWEAQPYRPDGLLAWKDLYREVADEKPPPCAAWNHSGLQAVTGGIPRGSLLTIAAGPASGKSTFVHELVHHFAARGERTGVLSLEQSDHETVCGLLTPLVNKPLHLEDDLNLRDYEAEAAKLDGMVTVYRHCGVMDANALEEKARFMAVAEGCSHVVLDNLSVVVSSTEGDNDRRTIDELLNRLVSLQKETGVTVILVVHLKRPQHGSYAEGRPVSLEDLRGSGMIEAMSYTVMSIERNQQGDDPTVATLRVLKSRRTGKAGVAGHARYDRDTGRLQECAEPEAVADF